MSAARLSFKAKQAILVVIHPPCLSTMHTLAGFLRSGAAYE